MVGPNPEAFRTKRARTARATPSPIDRRDNRGDPENGSCLLETQKAQDEDAHGDEHI
jgi:hypothetical protein